MFHDQQAHLPLYRNYLCQHPAGRVESAGLKPGPESVYLNEAKNLDQRHYDLAHVDHPAQRVAVLTAGFVLMISADQAKAAATVKG